MYRANDDVRTGAAPDRRPRTAAADEFSPPAFDGDPVTGAALELQDRAGNAAVAELIAGQAFPGPAFDRAPGPASASPTVQRQPVGPKSTTKWSGMAGRFETFLDPAKGPFTIQIFALTDDIIGHAWIGVKRSDGDHRTVGFWPNAIYSGIIGPGKLISADPHEGEEMHKYEQPATSDQVQRLLPILASWDGTLYSLLGHHCATFAHAAYVAVTGENFDAMWNDSMIMWSPATLGESIDDRKRTEAAWQRLREAGGPHASNDEGATGGGDAGGPATAGDSQVSDAGQQVALIGGSGGSSSADSGGLDTGGSSAPASDTTSSSTAVATDGGTSDTTVAVADAGSTSETEQDGSSVAA